MSKRRVSARRSEGVAKERISILYGLSISAVKAGRPDRAKRYISIARRIGQKTRTPMPEGARICKDCDLPMVPGINCRVRIGDHRVKITCLGCDSVKRMPYIKEQRE